MTERNGEVTEYPFQVDWSGEKPALVWGGRRPVPGPLKVDNVAARAEADPRQPCTSCHWSYWQNGMPGLFFGHDGLGHMISNLLSRNNRWHKSQMVFYSDDDLAFASDQALLEVHGLGLGALARIRSYVPHRTAKID